MNLDRPSYRIMHGGQEFVLPLRVCEDGYLSGFQRAALELIMQGYLQGTSVVTDPALAARFFPLALDLSGLPAVPWATWLELDTDVLEEVARDFFDGARRKIGQLTSSSVATRLKPAVDLISANVTWLRTTSSTPPAASTTSSGPGITPPGSPS